MNAGGAETFLMKIYRNIDRTRYQMDFCINIKEKCFYEDEILDMGGRIYRIPSKSENLKEFKSRLAAIIKNEGYDHVLRITSSAMGFMDLKIAKKAGAHICCARSSNASDGGGLKAWAVHRLGRFLYNKYVDVKIAPSDLAAQYTFGRKEHLSGKVSMLHNAVDLNTFHYNEISRRSVRKEFGISDNVKVVGHIGRFAEQKNHMFLANIFKAVHDKDPNTILLLVGDGALKSVFVKKINELGLSESVVFAGVRSDIPEMLSAMDVFVFPSFYEGMPNTVIEAQATGLPCVISDTITREADITGIVEYASLDLSAEEWANLIMPKFIMNRRDTKDDFCRNGYDIGSVAQDFVDLIWIKN
jgi:glycosyltransferase involved in cell wall biosynthesis